MSHRVRRVEAHGRRIVLEGTHHRLECVGRDETSIFCEHVTLALRETIAGVDGRVGIEQPPGDVDLFVNVIDIDMTPVDRV